MENVKLIAFGISASGVWTTVATKYKEFLTQQNCQLSSFIKLCKRLIKFTPIISSCVIAPFYKHAGNINPISRLLGIRRMKLASVELK